MSQDFTTRLQLQLREAAQREEQRGAVGRRLAGLRYGMPAPAAAVAIGMAALLVAVVIVAGGLRWGGGDETVSNPKVIGSVPLAQNLGSITAGFGSVWIADTDRQVLLRVDPRTRAVQAQIRTGGDPNANGGDPIVTAGAGAVWAIARNPGADGGHRILRIDPETDRVTSRAVLPARQAPLIGYVQIVQGRPWVVTSVGAIEIDPATGRPGRFVAIDQPASEPFPLWSILSPDGELWVLDRQGRTQRISLETGRQISAEPVPVPGAEAVVPTPLGPVYSSGGTIALVRPDGELAWKRTIGTSTVIPIVLGPTLWAHAADTAAGRDRIVEIDLRSGEVRSSTGLPEFGVSGIAVESGDLWISTPAGKATIVRPADR